MFYECSRRRWAAHILYGIRFPTRKISRLTDYTHRVRALNRKLQYYELISWKSCEYINYQRELKLGKMLT